jgi:cysteine desulfurase
MLSNNTIYLDYNATTPVDSIVLESMIPYFTHQFGNASSSTHSYGLQAKYAVENARKQVADFLEAKDSEIIFTSGASESIALALLGLYNAFKGFRNKIISTTVEHSAVLNVLDFLEENGVEVVKLAVDRNGLIDINQLKEQLDFNTFCVAIQLCNNETGVIQPLKQVSELAHHYNAIVFSDATQAPGKMFFNIHDLGIDLMPLSAHKVYGPKGVGALYIRKKNPRVILKPLFKGNTEEGLRNGTPNVAGIVGFGKALELTKDRLWEDISTMSKHRTLLEQALTEDNLGFVNGTTRSRLCNTTNIMFKDIRASELVAACKRLAFSLGSACSSNWGNPSHVLLAMGLTKTEAQSCVRISVGRYTTQQEILTAISYLKEELQNLKKKNDF